MRRLAQCCVATTLLLAASAQGRPEQPALHWTRGPGAEGCIDPGSLARRVEEITGPALVSAAAAQLAIEARIERARPRGYTLHLQVSRAGAAGRAERTLSFDAQDCRELDAALAFVVAVTIDPDLGAEGIPAELSWVDEQQAQASDLLAPARPPPPPASAPPPPAPRAPAEPDARQRWELGLAAQGGSGPDARLGAGLVANLSHSVLGRLAIGLQLQAASALGARELGRDRTTLTQNLGLALLACLDLGASMQLELRGCVGPSAGGWRADGRGFSRDHSSWLPSVGAAARFELRRPLDVRWSLLAAALLSFDALSRAVYYQQGGARVVLFEGQPVTVQAAVGLTYTF